MQLISPEFADREQNPPAFTCDGAGLSPPLRWSGVPDDAAELLITCEDPDAPSGTFVHWVMWGVDPDVGGIGPGTVPAGAHVGANDAGSIGYSSACPPRGH